MDLSIDGLSLLDNSLMISLSLSGKNKQGLQGTKAPGITKFNFILNLNIILKEFIKPFGYNNFKSSNYLVYLSVLEPSWLYLP